jgi:hypothetical protein
MEEGGADVRDHQVAVGSLGDALEFRQELLQGRGFGPDGRLREVVELTVVLVEARLRAVGGVVVEPHVEVAVDQRGEVGGQECQEGECRHEWLSAA